MKSVYMDIEETTLEFFLEEDNVDDKTKKKVKNLGFPQVNFDFAIDKNDDFVQGSDALFERGDFECSSIGISSTTSESNFSITFDEDKCSVLLKMSGTFFCHNDLEVDGFESEPIDFDRKYNGFVWAIRLKDAKGKPIKTKDEYCGSTQLDALADKGKYDARSLKVSFKLKFHNEIYYG